MIRIDELKAVSGLEAKTPESQPDAHLWEKKNVWWERHCLMFKRQAWVIAGSSPQK